MINSLVVLSESKDRYSSRKRLRVDTKGRNEKKTTALL